VFISLTALFSPSKTNVNAIKYAIEGVGSKASSS
jgi:hypothetical protein